MIDTILMAMLSTTMSAHRAQSCPVAFENIVEAPTAIITL
jgi:hypothetical protein